MNISSAASLAILISAAFFSLGALKNQVQHFQRRMLHGKNLQSVEC